VLQTWRLTKQDIGHVLVPPDVAVPDLAQRTFTAAVSKGSGLCPSPGEAIALQMRKKDARVTVMREGLTKQPTGWLSTLATHLEARDCLKPGEGMKLAGRVAESVPLEPAAAFRLLYSDEIQTGEVDLDAQTRLQVVSPYWREMGVGLMADGPYKVEETGSGYNLVVTGKSTENLLGYETAVYQVQRKRTGIGYTIVPLYADRKIEGQTERSAQPAINYLRFSGDAAFYRVLYKSWQNDFTAIVVAAHTPAELDERTKILNASGASASCEKLKGDMCIAIPRAVAVRPLMSVVVNGTEALMFRGTTVFQAIRSAGERQPESILARLKVRKGWNGQLIEVTFNPADTAILRLVLTGGESLSWK
jgi:hypothetical protein